MHALKHTIVCTHHTANNDNKQPTHNCYPCSANMQTMLASTSAVHWSDRDSPSMQCSCGLHISQWSDSHASVLKRYLGDTSGAVVWWLVCFCVFIVVWGACKFNRRFCEKRGDK